ncbi:histidine protein methyltransferase 1 homolog [Daktulosphaira vitifoliae]|uniref:histidine protein methyltransferase 1 homolog n=1 Tax=Daktulosphaira vitifoliae TaxID=58002 RepID=UPI0021AADF1A|nr:histidine protein methyltransferase 1 homolog [Daktulosphaira vitifoliae]XP_050536930.1 histidine protein methyltransferase 1 homolog [Daktulosphaira vitifoliae]
MFKFNFNNKVSKCSNLDKEKQELLEAEELPFLSLNTEEVPFSILTVENYIFKYALEKNDTYNSDLVPGVYEGGYKLWECSVDILKYLCKNVHILKEKSVLDLGCGHGLLGILALISGARKVDFQDYNKEVLVNITMNNIILNNIKNVTKCKFFCGDWESYNSLNEDKYDLILTSETIYNVNSYDKLIKLFKNKLKPTGFILLIAKNYYFGVGGSINEFLNVLESFKYHVETIWSSIDGVKKTLLKIYM